MALHTQNLILAFLPPTLSQPPARDLWPLPNTSALVSLVESHGHDCWAGLKRGDPTGSSSSRSHCCCCFSLAACTMQRPRLLLLLFLPLLLPGMWADPEGKWEPWLTPTTLTLLSEDPTGSSGESWPGHCPLHGGMIPSTKRPAPHHAAPKGALSLLTLSVPASSSWLHASPASAQGPGHPSRSEARGLQPGLQGPCGCQGVLSPM